MAVDFSKAYGFPPGFSFRREAFGGILYHYEGVKPDPRVTFIDNPFLLDLLARVNEEPLEILISGVVGHFGLDWADALAIRSFFTMLVERGAMVERSQMCESCGVPAQ